MRIRNPNDPARPTTTVTGRPRTTAATTPGALRNIPRPGTKVATGKPPVQRRLNTSSYRGQSAATPLVKPTFKNGGSVKKKSGK